MNVLVISNLFPPDTLGGDETGCAQVVDGLRALGHDVRVLTAAPRVPVASPPHVSRTFRLADLDSEYVRQRSAPVTRRLAEAESHAINAFNVHALLATLEDFSPDVVYAWSLAGIGGLGLLACLHHLRVPWVWQITGDDPATLCTLGGRIVPALARQVEQQLRGRCLVRNRQLIDELERVGIRLRGEVEVLPHWVAGPVPPSRPSFHRAGDVLRIVASAPRIGRSSARGIDLLIAASALLRSRGMERFALDIYGKVEDNSCADLIKSLGIEDRVRLRGPLGPSERAAVFQDYDVIASPTRRGDPGDSSPLEAATSGCVPVLGRLGGVSEWLVHGVHCLKAPSSAEGFAEAFRAILEGDVDLEPIGRRIAAVVRQDFHLDRFLPGIERVLGNAAGQPRTGGATAFEAYRLALLAEKLAGVLIQEPYCA